MTALSLSASLVAARAGKVGRPSVLPIFLREIENGEGLVILDTDAKSPVPLFAHRRNLLALVAEVGAVGITADTVRVEKAEDGTHVLVADGIAGLSVADLKEIGIADAPAPGKPHPADAKTRRVSTPAKKAPAKGRAKASKPRARKAPAVVAA